MEHNTIIVVFGFGISSSITLIRSNERLLATQLVETDVQNKMIFDKYHRLDNFCLKPNLLTH